MNAERLHAITLAVQDELARTRSVENMRALTTALTGLVNTPGDANAQAQLSNAIGELRSALTAAPSNTFSPSWRQTLIDLGIDDLLGEALLETVNDTIAGNQITPTVALHEIEPLATRISELNERLAQLQMSMAWLEIGHEELGPGEAEVGLLIPRDVIDERLRELGQELLWLRRALLPFSELTTGSRPELTVSAIASSDFSVFIHAHPVTAAAVAAAIERLIAGYKTILEIRKLRNEYAEQDGSSEALDLMDTDAASRINVVVEATVTDMLGQAKTTDEGRLNELRTDLTFSLRGFANRIDRGYGVDVRAGAIEPPDPDNEDAPQVAPDIAEAVNIIRNAAQALEFLNIEGQPILALPEGEQGADGDEPEAPRPPRKRPPPSRRDQ